jgi:hypothetical protein
MVKIRSMANLNTRRISPRVFVIKVYKVKNLGAAGNLQERMLEERIVSGGFVTKLSVFFH